MDINLIAPINALGYGVVGLNVLKSLDKAGHNVSLFPINNPIRNDDVAGFPKEIETIKKSILNSKMYNSEAQCVRIWHQNELDKFVGKNTHIGWPIFELNKFTPHELHHLEAVDKLFVCSHWAKKVLADAGIHHVSVVPLGVDPDVFYIDQQARNSRPYYSQDTTVFINVGKWEKRKGHEELVEAFSKAFTPDDDVELLMMNHNPFIGKHGNDTWKAKYISSPMGSKIKILDRLPTQGEMRELFNRVDFGVFPSHAEGWNLEILELMACGVPSIVTNYSGHTEYCDKTNSLLVEPNGMEPAQDGIWFHGQGDWCSYDVNDLVAQMKYAHQIKQSKEPNGMIANCLDTAKRFTWDKAIDKMIRAI